MKIPDLAAQVRSLSRAMMESGCRVDPRPWGVVISNAAFPRVDLANCAWIDRWPHGFSVGDVVADIAERCAQVGIPSERILFMDSRLAIREQDALERAGFNPRASLEMVHLRSRGVEPAKVVEVREATDPEVVEVFWRLFAESLVEDGYPDEDARQCLAFSPRRYEALSIRLFLARIDRHPAGFASMFSRSGLGYILDLATRAPDRRKGVGSAIVLRLLDASREAGNRFTGLTTAATNESAQRMYRKLGFFAAGERRSFVRDVPR